MGEILSGSTKPISISKMASTNSIFTSNGGKVTATVSFSSCIKINVLTGCRGEHNIDGKGGRKNERVKNDSMYVCMRSLK